MNYCKKHHGIDNLPKRVNLDHIMQKLPGNQSGAGRHKCTYCAFEAGQKAARRELKNQSFIRQILSKIWPNH